MAGFLRNLIALVLALFAPRVSGPRPVTTCHFRVTPWDTGFRILKSDRYLQIAEAAQADYLVKTRLLLKLVRGGVQFVNLAQLVRFSRPVAMFQRVRVESEVVYADEKCAWFAHSFWRGSERHAQVLVKMKFKKGGITLAPARFVDAAGHDKPAYLEDWDRALGAL
jgi:acyl-CoA thioesterase FadM